MDDWQGVAIADSRVVGIDLSDLGLTGTIPAELGSLTHLQSLNLNSNKLRGSIPAELGNLSNLQELTAYDNPVDRRDSKRTWQPRKPAIAKFQH